MVWKCTNGEQSSRPSFPDVLWYCNFENKTSDQHQRPITLGGRGVGFGCAGKHGSIRLSHLPQCNFEEKKSVVPVQLRVSFLQNFNFRDHFFPTKRFRCLTIFTFHEKKVARFCPSVVCVLRLWINNFFTGNSQGCGVPIAKSRIETF